jgi:hypothetical protein|nr:MAG TPA: hypothetical protein [Caudoviricetes sp.]
MNKRQFKYWLCINGFRPEQFGLARKGIRSGSLHERSELIVLSDPGDYFCAFISYVKLRYEKAEMYCV